MIQHLQVDSFILQKNCGLEVELLPFRPLSEQQWERYLSFSYFLIRN